MRTNSIATVSKGHYYGSGRHRLPVVLLVLVLPDAVDVDEVEPGGRAHHNLEGIIMLTLVSDFCSSLTEIRGEGYKYDERTDFFNFNFRL